jgi:hypothetical protein
MFHSLRLLFTIALLAVVSLIPLHNRWLQPADGPRTYYPPDDAIRVLHRRGQVKENLAKEVIAGRLTLFEAAAQFRRVNRVNPPDQLIGYNGDSQEECLCQQVIQFVAGVLSREDADNRDEWCRRLEEELRRYKQQHGKVLLPDDDFEDDADCPPPPSPPPAQRGGHDR